MSARIGCVAIGRNEGDRLIACLKSLLAESPGALVYVDSGSIDGSVDAARALGAEVVTLDREQPFTAARARNAGAERLRSGNFRYIQFTDGDCAIAPGWLGAAEDFLDRRADVAVVCGRRRERFPEQSIYNRLCDIEWDTPIGEATACGGDALMRADAFFAVGGYRSDLVAGEEPELCVRLREKNWRIWRLDADMSSHDAAIRKSSQWWRRSVRAGHAFAEVSTLHHRSDKSIWRRETLRALAWAFAAPAALALGVAVNPWSLLVLLIYPLQGLRLWIGARERLGEDAAAWAAASVAGKFAEAAGAISYYVSVLTRRRNRLIEYK
jgi:glycosyltransferase involved in cell wall biosynthesis